MNDKIIRDEKLLAEYRLIAEFEGAIIEPFRNFYTIEFPNRNKCWDTDLKYSTDWNWLMPVVEKIESLGEFGYCVTISSTWIRIYNQIHNTDTIVDMDTFNSKDTKIQDIYNAVVEFIKWYNEQEKDKLNG